MHAQKFDTPTHFRLTGLKKVKSLWSNIFSGLKMSENP